VFLNLDKILFVNLPLACLNDNPIVLWYINVILQIMIVISSSKFCVDVFMYERNKDPI